MTDKRKTHKWTDDLIRTGFLRFIEEYGHSPTSSEVDCYKHLPSSRQIQRRYEGGLPALRKILDLKGPHNFTKGEYSSSRAKLINDRAHKIEKEVYDYLIKRFGRISVHREYFFSDDRRNRTDFFVFTKSGNFSVDVFFPKDRHNFTGCINSKIRTYKDTQSIKYPIIFLMMNRELPKNMVGSIIGNRKNVLPENIFIMNEDDFKMYCMSMIPLKNVES